jgi:hypothetical protein
MRRATPFYFAVQTIGAAVLFWYAVPLFRQVLLDPGSHVPRTENLVWSLSAITLMQVAYWIRHRLRPPLPQLRNALVGYIVLFVARMSFVLATSVFGFVFIVRRLELQIPCRATLLSLLLCSPCSVTRRNSSNWEERVSVRISSKRRVSRLLTEVIVNFGLGRKSSLDILRE